MDFSNIFRLVNIAVGVIMVLGGISQFFPPIAMGNIIIGIYVIIFGLGSSKSIPPRIRDIRDKSQGLIVVIQLSPVWSSCLTSPTTSTATVHSCFPSWVAVSSTSSSAVSFSMATSSATSLAPSSVSPVSDTWLWSLFPPLSPHPTCASPTRAGAPSRSKLPVP